MLHFVLSVSLLIFIFLIPDVPVRLSTHNSEENHTSQKHNLSVLQNEFVIYSSLTLNTFLFVLLSESVLFVLTLAGFAVTLGHELKHKFLLLRCMFFIKNDIEHNEDCV